MSQKRSSEGSEAVSRLRQEIARRAAEMQALQETLLAHGAMLRGQVYETVTKCGKPTCHCATGEGHRAVLVSFKHGSGRKTRSIDPQTREELEPLAERYRSFRRARARWVQLAREVPSLLNDLETAQAVDIVPTLLERRAK